VIHALREVCFLQALDLLHQTKDNGMLFDGFDLYRLRRGFSRHVVVSRSDAPEYRNTTEKG
jgi:hypothetical protein